MFALSQKRVKALVDNRRSDSRYTVIALVPKGQNAEMTGQRQESRTGAGTAAAR